MVQFDFNKGILTFYPRKNFAFIVVHVLVECCVSSRISQGARIYETLVRTLKIKIKIIIIIIIMHKKTVVNHTHISIWIWQLTVLIDRWSHTSNVMVDWFHVRPAPWPRNEEQCHHFSLLATRATYHIPFDFQTISDQCQCGI